MRGGHYAGIGTAAGFKRHTTFKVIVTGSTWSKSDSSPIWWRGRRSVGNRAGELSFDDAEVKLSLHLGRHLVDFGGEDEVVFAQPADGVGP